MDKSGAGRVVIVTGGSRGIGAATALLAAKRGYAVAVNYVNNAAAAAKVVGEIESGGGRAIAVKGDVAVEADVLRLFDETAGKLGPVHGLVNNAGTSGRSTKFVDLRTDEIVALLQLNVVGSFVCAREAVKRMSTARGGQGGAIVNISSAAAYLGSPGEFIHYAASKGAIDTMTIGLSKEVAREGIRVNAVAPGMIDTEIHASSGDPGRVGRLVPTVPMARIGTAHEVAEAAVFLLSDDAAYITGTILRVTGGR